MQKTVQGTENDAKGGKRYKGAGKTMQKNGNVMQNVENDAKHGKQCKAGCKTKTEGWATCMGIAASQRSEEMQRTVSEAKSAF